MIETLTILSAIAYILGAKFSHRLCRDTLPRTSQIERGTVAALSWFGVLMIAYMAMLEMEED